MIFSEVFILQFQLESGLRRESIELVLPHQRVRIGRGGGVALQGGRASPQTTSV
jgi:hypothetical protein